MRNLTIAILFLFLILSGCKPQVRNEAPESKPLNVKVQAVEMFEYKIPVRATGLLSTSTEMKLSFKTGGIISQLHVREGESVRKGEVLARLDLSEIRAQVNQARIGLEKAERDLARAGNLYRDSVATLWPPWSSTRMLNRPLNLQNRERMWLILTSGIPR